MKELLESDLEKQIAILTKKLDRTEKSRILIEQAKDHYDMVYRSTIQKLDIQKNLLNSQNQELQAVKETLLLKNHELLLAQKSSELANQAKDQFLANMSHEIRTPLNGVLGFLELLALTGLSVEQERYLKEANQAAEILLYLINDILDFSKIESGNLTLESIAFDLRQVIEDAIATVRPKAIGKAISIEQWIDEDIVSLIFGDPNRVLQILNNLLSNGVKFTEKGFVKISVQVLKEDDTMQLLSIRVEDSGIGFNVEEAHRLFKVFSQVDPSITRKFGGTGLGLAITHELVHLMGGNITAESHLNGGAIFTAEIPFLKANGRVDLEEAKLQAKIERHAYDNLVDVHILLAEDNETNSHLIELMLKRLGLSCDVVSNGNLAYEACKLKDYDIILMDCQMPILDGYEATRLIRSLNNKSAQGTIIAMTASAMVGDKERCILAGMDHYLSKPISGPHFYTMMQSIADKLIWEKASEIQAIAFISDAHKLNAIATQLAQELECDMESVWGMINELIDHLEPITKELEVLIRDRDTEKALGRLEQLLSVATNMRFDSLKEKAEALELAIRNKAWDQVALKFEDLLNETIQLNHAKVAQV